MGNIYSSSLGQFHASAYHRSLATSSTIISYIWSYFFVGGGGSLRYNSYWLFQNYKKVIKCHEELTSC